MFNQENETMYVVLILAVLLILLVVYYITVVHPFIAARKYIKMEMARSSVREMKRWKREMRRAYVSLIPFIGNVLRKHVR